MYIGTRMNGWKMNVYVLLKGCVVHRLLFPVLGVSSHISLSHISRGILHYVICVLINVMSSTNPAYFICVVSVDCLLNNSNDFIALFCS